MERVLKRMLEQSNSDEKRQNDIPAEFQNDDISLVRFSAVVMIGYPVLGFLSSICSFIFFLSIIHLNLFSFLFRPFVIQYDVTANKIHSWLSLSSGRVASETM